MMLGTRDTADVMAVRNLAVLATIDSREGWKYLRRTATSSSSGPVSAIYGLFMPNVTVFFF